MKQGSRTEDAGGSTEVQQKRRRVDYATFLKWQRDLDRELETLSWLDCISEREGTKKIVAKLKCKVCEQFEDKIRGRKNFSDRWIVGAESVRVSNVRDHARNDQHPSRDVPPQAAAFTFSWIRTLILRSDRAGFEQNA